MARGFVYGPGEGARDPFTGSAADARLRTAIRRTLKDDGERVERQGRSLDGGQVLRERRRYASEALLVSKDDGDILAINEAEHGHRPARVDDASASSATGPRLITDC
jgi:hypothetical protein